MHVVLRGAVDEKLRKHHGEYTCPVCVLQGEQTVREWTETYFVRTMETASLRMLSPNTSMLRTGSTLRALKMAMVATGSTAEISEPKAKLQQESQNCSS